MSEYEASRIARALHGRRNGKGWVARCPAHDDHSPSLSVTSENGKVLVHCFTGCPQEAVIRALRSIGLWPEAPRHTPEEKIAHRRSKRDLSRALPTAEVWKVGFRDFLEDLLRFYSDKLCEPNPDFEELTAMKVYTDLLAKVKRLDDAGLVAEHEYWKKQTPGITRAITAVAQKHRLAEIKALAWYLTEVESC